MRTAALVVGVVLSILLLLTIGWFTGWSGPAIAAGILLLILFALFGAEKIGVVVNFPNIVGMLLGWAMVLCLGVVVWASIGHAWKNHKKEARFDEKSRRDSSVCKNDDGDWVKIPAGFHRPVGEDDCVEGKAPTPITPTPITTTEALVLERECYTPCSVNIAWRFRILRTEAIRIKWNGFDGWMKYPAKGDLKAPSQMRSGQTDIESDDPQHPNVRVQVYRKVTVATPR